MHGNVWEWTLDAYGTRHYAKFVGLTVDAEKIINWPAELYPRVSGERQMRIYPYTEQLLPIHRVTY